MSGAKVPYHLRQNKHIERELFIEILAHVDRVKSIKDYLYVGFGGVFFEDFKLLHSCFGVENMLSIESDKWIHARQLFNQPFGCMKCLKLTSNDFINDLNETRAAFPQAEHMLCWLDYAKPSALRSQMEEFRALIPKMEAYDIIKITINANVNTLASRMEGNILEEHLRAKRLEILRARIGDQLPEGVTSDDLTYDGYPKLLLKTIQSVAATAIKESPGLMFQPLAHYSYNDYAHRMMTSTGIILQSSKASSFIKKAKLKRSEFSGLDWRLIDIDIPYLSLREKLTLDRKMFDVDVAALETDLGFLFDEDPEISRKMVSEYKKYHQFYPHYHRISY